MPKKADVRVSPLNFLLRHHDRRSDQPISMSLPRQNFSETVLEAALPFLAVSTLPPLTWSDLGTPRRVFKLLRTLRISPAWMRGRRPGLAAAQRVG